MAFSVHVTTQEIAEIIVDKPFSSLLRTHTIISGKREQIYLELNSGIVQGTITVVADSIIRITLWMCQYRAEALQLNVEHNVVEHQQLLLIAILKQNKIARQRHQAALIALLNPIFVHSILCRVMHI